MTPVCVCDCGAVFHVPDGTGAHVGGCTRCGACHSYQPAADTPAAVEPGAGFDDTMTLTHCGVVPELRRAVCGWQGDEEVTSLTARCRDLRCRAEITVSVRRWVGPPVGLPGERS